MPVLLGALGSVLIGFSDFFGRRSSGESSAVATVHVAAWAGATAGAILALILRNQPGVRDLVLGSLSGFASGAGLAMLYRAMVVSTVGVVSPVAAVTTAVATVAVDVGRGNRPTALVTVGIVLGLVSLIAAAWDDDGGDRRTGIALAVGAGLIFAVMLLLGAATSDDSGLWPLVAQRVTAGAALAVFAVSRGVELAPPTRALRRTAAMGGVFGSLGIGVTFLGLQRGEVGAVSVASSMYPAVTVALRWIADGERLHAHQIAGLAGSLLAVGLIVG